MQNTNSYYRTIADKQINPNGTTNITASVVTSDKAKDGWLYIGTLTVWFDGDEHIEPYTKRDYQVFVKYDPTVRNPSVRNGR